MKRLESLQIGDVVGMQPIVNSTNDWNEAVVMQNLSGN